MQARNIKIFIILAVIIISVLFFYNLSSFRVVDTNFPNDKLPTYEDSLIIKFSKKLDPNSQINPKISNNVINILFYDISENELIITLERNINENENINITIDGISSANNRKMVLNYDIVGVFVPGNNVPKKDNQRLLNNSQNEQDPITGDLPIVTDNYDINYAYSYDNDSYELVVIVSSNAIPEEFNTNEDYLNRIRSDRQEALKLIANTGYDIGKYKIYYKEDVLLDEFKAQSISTINLVN
ncbi:MAG: hypothetical protein MUF85_00560 [Patescibacteria group bacterium]|jgi:hypothetical protein|nr:hypothetical protein [Patescibacteria group bacterium]